MVAAPRWATLLDRLATGGMLKRSMRRQNTCVLLPHVRETSEPERKRRHVSIQNPPQAPQQTTGEIAANKEIVEHFRREEVVRTQPRLRGLRGVCRFDIIGVGTWGLAVNDGEASFIEGAGNALPADCVVTSSAEDMLRVIRQENHMDLLTAAMQGLVTITGDKVFAVTVLGHYTETRGAAGQQR